MTAPAPDLGRVIAFYARFSREGFPSGPSWMMYYNPAIPYTPVLMGSENKDANSLLYYDPVEKSVRLANGMYMSVLAGGGFPGFDIQWRPRDTSGNLQVRCTLYVACCMLHNVHCTHSTHVT
jgi:hypothetical protein